jgi:hypothetical protein
MGPQNRLGAKGLVARQYLFLRFMAIALDLPCALALSKFAVPLFLATVTALACSIPARPIARVDPRQALCDTQVIGPVSGKASSAARFKTISSYRTLLVTITVTLMR